MASTCSRAAFRLIVSILLFISIANAATLPHYALDPRTPLAQVAEVPSGTLDIAAAPTADEIDRPKNIWEQISDILHMHDGYEVLRDLLERIFSSRPDGPEDEDEDEDDADETVTTTVYITPTPVEQSSSATSESLVTPPGPPPTTTLELSISVTPTTSSEEIFSILPVGPMTTAIDATLPDPELASLTSTLESASSSLSESAIGPPFSVNTMSASAPTLTPVVITEQFSAALPSISLTASWSGNASTTTIDPSILTNPIRPTISPSSNETGNGTSTTKVRWTSLIIITATVVPSPVEETGTGVLTPISDTATLLWPNSSFIAPTGGVSGTISVSAATGISNATATAIETPLFPNTTFVIPTLVTVTGSPGSALNVSLPVTIPPFANTTYVLPTPMPGTGSPVTAANTSTSEILTFSNTTYVTPTALPGTGGTPGPSAGTISNAPIPFTEIPYFPNATATEPTVLSGTGTAPPVIAETASSAPGLEPNVTTTVSTTTTTLALETPTITPTPNDTDVVDSTIEFPGLLALRRLCQDPQIRVITLPLLNRFYGPSAYPSLFAFPGCVAPNDRQAVQAPGLLNCTALGAEVQRCQASGRKVFLSVKGDDVGAVGGNANFGDPSIPTEPFGPYFVDANADDGDQKRKRQLMRVEDVKPIPIVIATPPARVSEDQQDSASVVAEPAVTPESKSTIVTEAPVVVELPAVLISPVVVESPVISEPSALLEPSIISEASDNPRPTLLAEPPLVAEPSIIAAPSATSEPSIFIESIITEPSAIPLILPYPSNPSEPLLAFPNLFDTSHPPSALALILFGLFGEGHTERLDLRPLGPDATSPTTSITSSDAIELGQTLERPLGEEVVVDGYDVQLPAQWKGRYQETKFKELVARLRQLNREAWKASGGVEGGKGDLGADGRPEVYFGWVGEMVRARKVIGGRTGWVEWDGGGFKVKWEIFGWRG